MHVFNVWAYAEANSHHCGLCYSVPIVTAGHKSQNSSGEKLLIMYWSANSRGFGDFQNIS